MPYITSRESFQGYAHAIIVGVYADGITASAVKKENNALVLVSSAMESMSGAVGELMPVDNVLFNTEKAIVALPPEVRAPGTAVIVAIGPGVGACEYRAIRNDRESRDKKIDAEEIDAIVASGNGEKGSDRVVANYPEYFSIDGFSISDPIGVNGKEISVGTVRVSCAEAFEKECAARFSELGFQYKGLLDMRYAAMHASSFFERSASALLVFVFEHETHVAIVREKAVHAVGRADVGYGILDMDIARAFSVGVQEAKEIVRAYRKHELNEGTRVLVEQAANAAAKNVADATKETIKGIDSANIIPGNIHVVCARPAPELTAQLLAGEWLKDLPLERNASIGMFPEALWKGFAMPFDFMSADFLLRHFT